MTSLNGKSGVWEIEKEISTEFESEEKLFSRGITFEKGAKKSIIIAQGRPRFKSTFKSVNLNDKSITKSYPSFSSSHTAFAYRYTPSSHFVSAVFGVRFYFIKFFFILLFFKFIY